MGDTSTALIAVGGLAAAVTAVLVLRAAPRVTVVVWLLVLCFVPIWVGVSVGPFWSAITLMTALAIVTCSGSVALSPADGLMAAFFILVIAQFALGMTSLAGAVSAVSEWLVPYLWGRLVLTRVSREFLFRAIAVIAGVAAALALIEALSGTNFFVLITFGSDSLASVWASLQPRGGLIRAEGAFGHSIALGASLSLATAFVLAAKWRMLVKLALLIVIAAAIVMTLSRIGLVTFVITVALSVLVLPGLSRGARWLTAATGIVAATVIVPFIGRVFLEAGTEAGGSADYRLDLFSVLQVLRPVGAAPDITGLTVNGDYLGSFARSIDNALLVTAMRVGWAPTLLLIVVLLCTILPIVRRGGANAASIAIAAQIPGLFAVAFITQYSTFFWFTAGLAVSLNMAALRRPQPGGMPQASHFAERLTSPVPHPTPTRGGSR